MEDSPPTIHPLDPAPGPLVQPLPPTAKWIWPRIFIYGFLGAFIGLNMLAWFHGRAMSRYVTGSERTATPEKLNVFDKIKVLLTGVNFPRPENSSTPTDFGLPFGEVTFEGAFGVQLAAWQIENATNRGLILMFHGHGAAKESLLPAADLLYKMGWDCALIDFHGSGDSGTNVSSIGWHEATDVVAAVEYFRPMYENEPVILYGISMGSAAVLRAMHTEHIQPDGIILELPYDQLINAARERFKAMRIPLWPAAEFLIFYGGMHGSFNGFDLQPVEYAKSVYCPTLVMNGELDPRAPPAQALAVFNNLSGPKTHKQFKGLGHRNFSRHDAPVWSATVTNFLSTIRQRHR
jgi:uncharacterized protein